MPTEDAAWREVGHEVASRRASLGIATQLELAELAGVHKNTISRLELGLLRRQGRAWARIEAALGWPAGRLMALYREFKDRSGRVPAEVVERAVLEAITESAPHVTVRQARQIADGALRRIEQQGFLSGARRG